MTLRDKLTAVKLKQFIDAESEFEFPEFLRCIRRAQGITRKQMSNDLGITEMKIYYKEEGKFTRMPEIDLIVSMAEYLGIPKKLLLNKARIYILKKK